MRQDFFEFDRTHKLIMHTNNKPRVNEDSTAVWRRLRLIPFDVSIPEEKQDKNLQEKLLEERSGILNRLLEGCLDWQENGLQEPEEVKIATSNYRSDENPIHQFIQDECIQAPEARTPATQMLNVFNTWARFNGTEEISARELSKLLKDVGIEKKNARINGKVAKCYEGIGFENNEFLEG
jgi:putative DNA primase/helicase